MAWNELLQDITDRAGRLLGIVSVTGEVEVKNDTGNPLNVAISTGTNNIGKVSMQVGGADLSSSNPTFADITDKAARVLGVATLGAGTASIGKVTAQQLDRISVAPVTGVKTVSSTAAAMFAGASQLANRYNMAVYNESANTLYLGPAGVTTATGYPLLPGDSVSFGFLPTVNVAVYFIATANSNVRVVELA